MDPRKGDFGEAELVGGGEGQIVIPGDYSGESRAGKREGNGGQFECRLKAEEVDEAGIEEQVPAGELDTVQVEDRQEEGHRLEHHIVVSGREGGGEEEELGRGRRWSDAEVAEILYLKMEMIEEEKKRERM